MVLTSERQAFTVVLLRAILSLILGGMDKFPPEEYRIYKVWSKTVAEAWTNNSRTGRTTNYQQLQSKIMHLHITPAIIIHQPIKPMNASLQNRENKPYVVDMSDLKSVVVAKCSGCECRANSCVEEPLKDTFLIFSFSITTYCCILFRL